MTRGRIGVIARWLNPVLTEACAELRRRGFAVETIDPAARARPLAELRVEHALYVLKAGDPLAMSLAGALDAMGAAIINPLDVVRRLRDKVVVTQTLARAGVPVPPSWIAASAAELRGLLDGGPLIVKPHDGSNGRGIRIVRNPDDLADTGAAPVFVFAQRYLPPDGDGRDAKIFRIGARHFGVRRPWPLTRYDDKLGEPFEVPPALVDLSLAIGRAFGIDLYGLDVITSGGAPYVVDVNKFGSYMGVPGGAALLADHLEAAHDA